MPASAYLPPILYHCSWPTTWGEPVIVWHNFFSFWTTYGQNKVLKNPLTTIKVWKTSQIWCNIREAPFWNALVLYDGHCPNSFRTPPPPLSRGQKWIKVPKTILASLYTPTPLIDNAHIETIHFKKGPPLVMMRKTVTWLQVMSLTCGFGNVSSYNELRLYGFEQKSIKRPLLIEGYWSAALCVIGNSCTRWKGNGRQGNHCKHQEARGISWSG